MDYFRNEVEDRHRVRTYVLQRESQMLKDAEKAFEIGDSKALSMAVIGIGKILLVIATLLIENLKHK